MNNTKAYYDLIVIGSGAAGMIASISAAKNGKKVLLLEKLSKTGSKLKATGGGKCNLTNTLDKETFMEYFGKNGRFMQNALNNFDQNDLRDFFQDLGVASHSPDGFRVFPITHNSNTIIHALENEMKKLNIDIKHNQKVEKLQLNDRQIKGVTTQNSNYHATNVIIATGGLGYPSLGTEGDGYDLAKSVGHKVTKLHPAMMPLITKERWVAECRADTIAKATIRIDLKKTKRLKAVGDLIFTQNGIRGPVVLDFAREITPLLDRYEEVPILINLTHILNEDQIYKHIKNYPKNSIIETISTLLPKSVATQLCKLCDINPNDSFKNIDGKKREKLIKTLTWTPLTVTGHDGFNKAMITRGGISLKEIDPNTMQSKLIKGLYFCGEIVDLDGPCGGYNLQWSFSSGFLAGSSIL
jgi:predicted Rossmann fold flavoprotein